METWVQIQDEAFVFHVDTNLFWKGINLSILSAIGKQWSQLSSLALVRQPV